MEYPAQCSLHAELLLTKSLIDRLKKHKKHNSKYQEHLMIYLDNIASECRCSNTQIMNIEQ